MKTIKKVPFRLVIIFIGIGIALVASIYFVCHEPQRLSAVLIGPYESNGQMIICYRVRNDGENSITLQKGALRGSIVHFGEQVFSYHGPDDEMILQPKETYMEEIPLNSLENGTYDVSFYVKADRVTVESYKQFVLPGGKVKKSGTKTDTE